VRRVPLATSAFIRTTIRVASTGLLVLVICATDASRARGDGDPASDVLLVQSVFYPYQPPVPHALESALNNLLTAAARAHMPLKVALIGSREELGLVPEYFGRPQAYAKFLDREISYNRPQPLLVVMPAGFGLVAAGPASALAHVPIDARRRTYGLTRAAILAVIALARANGHPVATPSIPPAIPAAHGGLPAALLFALPVALLALAGLVAMRRGRSRPAEDPAEGHMD
jgi:hypothetical protein